MKKNVSSFILAGIFLLGLSACSKSSDSVTVGDSGQSIFMGALDKKMSEIYSKENESRMDVCDLQWKDRILEISRVLEQKRADIEVLGRKNAGNQPQTYVKFGDSQFSDNTDLVAGKDEWTKKTRSWSHLAKVYMLVKDDPTDPRWVDLNRSARGMVTDDDSRITRSQFMGLSRTAGPLVLTILGKLQNCLKQTECTNPLLSNEEAVFLGASKNYTWYIWALAKSNKPDTEKRVALQNFANRLGRDAERYSFKINPAIHSENSTLIVPMNLSVFGDIGGALFAQYLETIWSKGSAYSVKVISTADTAGAFTVNVSDEFGGRAHVNRAQLLMQLYNFSNIKTFAHEFGHILGFTDNYYTTWSTDTCAYTEESNASDIMSVSSNGAVTPSHWDVLKSKYWPQAVPQP